MKKAKEFSALHVPLTGTQLIEASAGTGKTHTITELFLRFILEKKLTVDQILVVTFTETATEELRDRIRKKLREAINIFSGCSKKARHDKTLCEMAESHADRVSAVKCLQHAVANFDEAAIFTIHSFCLQVLKDHAFESGTLFDTDLITSQEHLIREAVDDFWRRHFYLSSALFVSYATKKKFSPDSLLNLTTAYTNNPLLKIIPESALPDTKEAEGSFIKSFNRAARLWPDVREEVKEILMSHDGLNRTKYRLSSIPKWANSLDDCLMAGEASMDLPEKFEKFTPSVLSEASKRKAPPEHTFFNLCDDLLKRAGHLQELYDRRLLYLKGLFFAHMRVELERKKSEQNVQYFDDLLLKVYRAIKLSPGERLPGNIRRRFKAALIDEFQDTDQVQYEIFKNIFQHKDTALVLIGDPKQSIYSFRNADIFTYMKASGSVKTPLTIGKNWRSEPELIQALNTLFSQHKNPFLYDRISFTTALPALSSHKKKLLVNASKEPPFHLWFFRADKEANKKSRINKPDISLLIARAVANETVRLLNQAAQNKICIGDRVLQTGDVAVLVRTHAQARLVQQELSQRSVPCILHSAGYIFETDQARDLYRVLEGIAHPNNERLVKAAMTTDIMGTTGKELYMLLENETEWENRILNFRDYHEMWNRDGFFQMFGQFMLREQVKQRLISMPDGGRCLTNLLHLSEIIHKQSAETNPGMRGLVKWLAEQMNMDGKDVDEHLLRLESDQGAVKIVTIHKSKGLEYPVVFCPFAWAGGRESKNGVLFHDRDDELKLDLGSSQQEVHRQYALEENMAEDMRLLYVAMTRAINRCYLVWGGFKDADTSALACLFHNQNQEGTTDVVQNTAELFMRLSDDDILSKIKEYEVLSKGAITVREVSDDPPLCYSHIPVIQQKKLSHRVFPRAIGQEWWVTSFSSLVSGKTHEPEFPDSDEFCFFSEEEHKEQIHMLDPGPLPSGAKAGTMLHDILEHFDFTDPDSRSMEKLISDKLLEYDFDEKWNPAVSTMIKNVISVQLDPDDKGFTLAKIRDKDRVAELGFYFPLRPVSVKILQNLFSKHACQGSLKNFPSQIGDLNFSPVQGFMKGFIDLVFQYNSRFYLVDWKSNLLGANPEDYKQENLSTVMERDFYILQYHLYTLALHQYLSGRVTNYSYEKHFGGVYYIFLRGVDPLLGPRYGIYRDRPSEKMIEEMKRQLVKFN